MKESNNNMGIIATATIPFDFKDEAEDNVKRLAKRAIKKGFPAPSITFNNKRVEERHDYDGNPYNVEVIDAEVSCNVERLAINGWHLGGVVTPFTVVDGDSKVTEEYLYTAVPESKVQRYSTDDASKCQHCNTRRWRVETFVLVHDDGSIKQVGRQCIRDFLGHDPAALLWYMDLGESIGLNEDRINGWLGAASRVYKHDEVLAIAAAVVSVDGFFISRKKAEDEHRISTTEVVKRMLNPTKYDIKMWEEQYAPKIDDGVVQSIISNTNEAIIEMKKKDAKGDWEWSIEDAFRLPAIPLKGVGIVASAVILGMRRMEQFAAKKVKAEKAPSVHVGKVGDRIKNIKATVEFVRFFDNNFGGSFLCKFRTDDADLQWWASSLPGGEYNYEENRYEPGLKQGDEVVITGTVKAHDIDRYTSQPVTILTRCKVDITKAAPAA